MSHDHRFVGDLQNLKPCFSEMNPSNLEQMIGTNNQMRSLHQSFFGSSITYDDQELLSFSDNHQQPEQLPTNFADDNAECFLNNISAPPVSGTGIVMSENIKSFGGSKRKRKDEKNMEKPREVIHVRAKRGQATDSHSLAERVRREKINEKLRCLQDLVPGCYKTMGMAVMLDVIINYVQSLQSQIEFLSMKLSAASMYYDFNLERHNMEAMQGTNACEVQEIERMEREGYGGPSYFHSAWPF